MRVAIGGFHFDHAFAHFQNRNVERAAAKVIHGNRLVLALVESVSKCRRRRLVDDSLHVEPGNLSRIFRRLPLRIVKIRRHRDYRLGHFFSEIIFRRLLQFLQDHRRNLRRSVFLPLRHHSHVVALPHYPIWDHLQFFADLVIAPSHKALDRIHRVLRIGNGLPLGDLPHQPFPGLGKSHHRRRSPTTFFIRDNLGLSPLHNRHAGVRSPQVNSNDLAHNPSSNLVKILDKCFIINTVMITASAIL